VSVLGLVVEYNPFHNGHLYHFNTSYDITQAEYSVCVMSGNFVQRGEPAIVDKWSRAKMALNAGIDLCIELPVIYCIQSAEIFSYGAISILNNLGIVDAICFGSEVGDIELLKSIAEIVSNEPLIYKKTLKEKIKEGLPFAAARANALAKSMSDYNSDIHKVLESSNNILSIEYLKWLLRLKSPIKPVTIKRMSSSYNDETLDTHFPSATALRKAIYDSENSNILNEIKNLLPGYSAKIIEEQIKNKTGPVFLDDFAQVILSTLRRSSISDISNIMDVNEGLEYRIKKSAIDSFDLKGLIQSIKSKRYTETRIKRILIHSLLGIKKEDLLYFKDTNGPQYIRVLGFSDKGRKLLNNIKKKCPIPIITNTSDYRKYNNPYLSKMIELDIRATDIYVTAYKNAKSRKGGLDFYKKPIYKKQQDAF